MQKVDALIAAALVVAAGGSALGLVLYEADTPGRFAVTFQEAAADPVSLDAQNRDGTGALTFEAELPVDNITRVVVDVSASASGARPQPVTVTVTVTGPGLEPVTVTGELPPGGPGAAGVPVEVAVAPLPDAFTRTASDASAIELPENSTLGRGTWTVEVTFSGGAVSLPETYGADVTLTPHTYAASVAAYVPDTEVR